MFKLVSSSVVSSVSDVGGRSYPNCSRETEPLFEHIYGCRSGLIPRKYNINGKPLYSKYKAVREDGKQIQCYQETTFELDDEVATINLAAITMAREDFLNLMRSGLYAIEYSINGVEIATVGYDILNTYTKILTGAETDPQILQWGVLSQVNAGQQQVKLPVIKTREILHCNACYEAFTIKLICKGFWDRTVTEGICISAETLPRVDDLGPSPLEFNIHTYEGVVKGFTICQGDVEVKYEPILNFMHPSIDLSMSNVGAAPTPLQRANSYPVSQRKGSDSSGGGSSHRQRSRPHQRSQKRRSTIR